MPGDQDGARTAVGAQPVQAGGVGEPQGGADPGAGAGEGEQRAVVVGALEGGRVVEQGVVEHAAGLRLVAGR
ncbi:hypothetical protein GCM10009639_00090 [Kitasatospora putterlickiae]|uniref:Uncharacterized protein n=1 Tax=Kitasatospora putterlickiae TaxID=221725 RepID=A0ABN1XNN7_9ACTN